METPRGARFGEHKSSALFGFRRAVPTLAADIPGVPKKLIHKI